MPIQSVERTAAPDDILATLERDGVVIIRELIDRTTMQGLMGKIEPRLAERKTGGGKFFGYRKRSIGALFSHGPELSQLPLNPVVQSLADTVLGPSCNTYQLHATGAIQVWGDGQNQPLHRELDAYTPFIQPKPDDPEYILFFMFAGSDFSAENGATRLVPGSHRWSADRHATEAEVCQAVMSQGSAVVWLGKTLHGLGTNTTDSPRTGLFFSFSVGWLRQEENQYLAVPVDIAKELPEGLQQLLGYQAHGTFLGWVDGRDSELQTRETPLEMFEDVEGVTY